jgi:LacI family transcriptional regulator
MKNKMNVDIIDVANHAGVSPATVSRSFNHPDKVLASTRKRIEKAIAQTGYIRNRAAQAIHGKRSGTVGLIVPTLDNAIFSNLIQAFSNEMRQNGFTMLVATHGYDLNDEYALLRSLLEHRIEGVALIGDDHSEDTYNLLELRNVPVVSMWNYKKDSKISCVGGENDKAGQAIAKHVVGLGHKQIAIAFPSIKENDRARDRKRGVLDQLLRAEITVPENWQIDTAYSIEDARQSATLMLESGPHPTAIIAGNDVIAQGVIYAVQAKGLKVPNDISVTGIGDFSGSASAFPSLTTVRMRPNKVGGIAAAVLLERINGERGTGPTRTRVPVEVKDRDSARMLRD